MTWQEALAIVLQQPHYARYADLLDPSHKDYDPRNEAVVIALAEGRSLVSAPSLAQKAVNFAGAVVSHVAAGMPVLPPEQTAARLAICEPCEFRRDRTCEICGCQLATKASWADQDCPRGKWPEPLSVESESA